MKALLKKAVFRLPNGLFKIIIGVYATIANRSICTLSEIGNAWQLQKKKMKNLIFLIEIVLELAPSNYHINMSIFIE